MIGPVPVTALIVAKSPVPGQVKTRLAASVGDAIAAHLAAAALMDTLEAVADAPFTRRILALSGDLRQGLSSAEISNRLNGFHVITQRGETFGERLAHAHADAAAVSGGAAILQIGMDTPQVTAELLARCARRLESAPAVLGPARDGGWWALGVREAAMAACLIGVPMSRPDTGALTAAALTRAGTAITYLEELSDVDTIEDVATVLAACLPSSRFARACRAIGPVPTTSPTA